MDSTRDLANADVLVITNATILTMESGSGTDLIDSGAIVTRGGVITSVGPSRNAVIPHGATVIDAQGGTSLALVF